MSLRQRIVLALLAAVVSAAYVLASPLLFPAYLSDFDQLWIAGRAWRDGADPYAVVADFWRGQAQTFGLLYPFTAVVAVLPLSFLPMEWARALFVASGAFCFTYLLLGRAWWLFPILLSASMRGAVSSGQVAPFVACAVMVPWFGAVAAFKPNIGLVAAGALTDRASLLKFLAPAAALTIVSLALWPIWPFAWLDAVRTGTANRPLVMQPGGVILLLALFRWREPEARWLALMAIVPINPKVYDALPLLVLLPRSLRGALGWALLTHVIELAAYAVAQRGGASYDAQSFYHARFLLWGVYVPVLIAILTRPITVRSQRS